MHAKLSRFRVSDLNYVFDSYKLFKQAKLIGSKKKIDLMGPAFNYLQGLFCYFKKKAAGLFIKGLDTQHASNTFIQLTRRQQVD